MVGVQLESSNTEAPLSGFRLSDTPAFIRGPQWLQLPLLTLGFLGTQIVWSVEMAYGTPYLLELGLSKATMAVVFMAGPISGLLVQPVVGVLADQSTHKLGRRRPYLLAASLVCSFFVLLLGFARIPASLFGIEGATPILTIIGIWGLDFAVNAVMALERSLLLDMLPADQQAAGNAWVARICSIGSIFGFYVGDLDLPNTMPFSWMSFLIKSGCKAPSEPQVRCLSLLTAFWMVFTHLIVIWAAVERRLVRICDVQGTDTVSGKVSHKALKILLRSFHEFAQTAKQLSEPIKAIFKVQIFSWICWFPLLFYSTEWVSQAAVASIRKKAEQSGVAVDPDAIRAQGTRAGSHAMFLQALVSFAASILLPLLLPPSEDLTSDPRRTAGQQVPVTPSYKHRRIWLAPSWLPNIIQDGLEDAHSCLSRSTHQSPRHFKGIKLTSMWLISHFALAFITWFTYPVSYLQSLSGATLLITLIGFCWAVTNWAPYALLGIFVRSDDGEGKPTTHGDYESIPMQAESSTDGSVQQRHASTGEIDPLDGEAEEGEEGEELFFNPTNTSGSAGQDNSNRHDAVESKSETATKAGSILGLHNIAIVIPQMIVSLSASIIFALFEPKKASITTSTPGVSPAVPPIASDNEASEISQSDAVNIVFVIGGVFSFAAGLMTIRLSRKFERLSA
ncbi:unnamed protein product [Sympodiomycopsis kandeliae]